MVECLYETGNGYISGSGLSSPAIFKSFETGLDEIFGALSDPTRRDILRRVASTQLTISQIAKDYNLTFAAVSKHLKVMEKARLIIKRKVGRRQFVVAHPAALKDASEYLEKYHKLWEDRLDALDEYLKEEEAR